VSAKLKIVVLGMMGRCPFGGQTWLYLNWLRGLSRLGHEVWYVEDDSVWPYDPLQDRVTNDCSYAIQHISGAMEAIGLGEQWAFRLSGAPDVCGGPGAGHLTQLYRSSDLLLNVVGATDLREEHLAIPMRVYVECDPVTAELRLANGDEHTRIAFDQHHAIATYGENYGAGDCGVPLNGRKYLKTRQPVDLEWWSPAFTAEAEFFTTIGNYRQSGNDETYNGETYRWSKHHEWEKFIDLPQRTGQRFHAAVKVDEADRARLEGYGWRVDCPLQMSLDTFGAYRKFFCTSRGEWTVAKDQNVRLRSGWFSERDACYLASGKPVVVQDTGFGQALPTGQGLFGFSTMEDVLAALEEINSDYARHCRAARAVAEEYFDAPKVAGRLLEELGA
jgi:hypothetical protein